MTRPEVALALVTEAALEHEEPVRRHAPLLAHLALLLGDAPAGPAAALAPSLLAHLLAALSLPHLQLQRASGVLRPPCAATPMQGNGVVTWSRSTLLLAASSAACLSAWRQQECRVCSVPGSTDKSPIGGFPHVPLTAGAGGMVEEYEAAAGMLMQLQALGSGPLWPREARARPSTSSMIASAALPGSSLQLLFRTKPAVCCCICLRASCVSCT